MSERAGKIFGIGLARTGTTSLIAALETLGFSDVQFPTRTEQIENCDPATNTPEANAFEKLDEQYPDSRFILTARDRDDWLTSCESFWKEHEALFSSHPYVMALHSYLYGGIEFGSERFAKAYDRHTEKVRRYFADRAGDLLVLDISDGGNPWQPLCSFLERAVPDMPCPHERRSDLGGEKFARRLSIHPLSNQSLDFPTATEPRIFYTICHTPRRGSHYLAREMWRTGCFGAPHEYFNVHIVMLEMSARLGARSLSEYAARLVRTRTGPNGVFGLKTAFIHFMFFATRRNTALGSSP